MSKSEVKPFKIRQSILYPGGSKPEGAPDFCTIEVIEYFSYQSLQKENEELKAVAEGNLKISLKHQDKNIRYLKQIKELKGRVVELERSLAECIIDTRV